MYANYEVNGETRLGFFDGATMVRLKGPSTDELLRIGFPPVPADAPVEHDPFRLLPAVLSPGKIICLLRSYRAHAEELGNVAPPEPMFFAKLNNTLIGSGEAIEIPGTWSGKYTTKANWRW